MPLFQSPPRRPNHLRKSLSTLIIFGSALFTSQATEITVGAGSILKNQFGDVLTTGKAYAFSDDIKTIASAVKFSDVPRTKDELLNFLESEPKSISFRPGDIDIINDSLAKLRPQYLNIKQAAVDDARNNSEARIKSSPEYLRDMQKADNLARIKSNYNDALGEINSKLGELEKEKQDLESRLSSLDDRLVSDANAIISAKSANPRLIDKKGKSIKLLKFKKSSVDRKTGECKQPKRAYLIDRQGKYETCFQWSIAKAWREHTDEIGAKAEQYFDEYYAIKTALSGSGRKDKNSLTNRIKALKKEHKAAFKLFRQNNDISLPSHSGLLEKFRKIDALKVRWQNTIRNAKNAGFNPNQSRDFEQMIMNPYLTELQQYYLTIADDILDSFVEDVVSLSDYKFEIDDAPYYALYIDMQSSGMHPNFGIFVESQGTEQLMAQQFRNNTLPFGFQPNYSDREYVVGTLLLLMD